MRSLILRLALVASLIAAGQAISQEYNRVSVRTRTVIDSTYARLVKKYKVTGLSLAIVDSGRIVYANGYGFADREKQVPATARTIYRIGSCTKSFTSLSLMQLNEQKKIDINRPVKEYLPELTISSRFNDNNPIYINDMMCHVSGLPCDIMNGFFCDAPPDINWEIRQLNLQTTMSPRRYKHAYSNVAYGLLGEVVARASNSSYSAYVRERIFRPLDMRSSYIENDTALCSAFSKAYLKNKVIQEPMIRDQAAGLIHSNVTDMSNYLLMYLNKGSFNGRQIVSAESIRDMEANHIGDITLTNPESWGYGLYSEKMSVKSGKDSSIVTMTGHGGDTYAFHSDFAYIPELGVGVVILTNSDNGVRINNASRLLKIYLKAAKGKKMSVSTYKDPGAEKGTEARERATKAEERIGKYLMGEFLIDVKRTEKIKFKQGPATVILRQKAGNPNAYSLTAVVFKIIRSKAKNTELQFVKIDNDVYLKAIDTKNKQADYIGIRSQAEIIPAEWKSRFGNYRLAQPPYSCTGCPYGNAEGMTMTLLEKDGFMVLKTKGKTPDTKNSVYSHIVSDRLAVTGGIGRGTGETIRVLDNGHIYYSGFEFEKVK